MSGMLIYDCDCCTPQKTSWSATNRSVILCRLPVVTGRSHERSRCRFLPDTTKGGVALRHSATSPPATTSAVNQQPAIQWEFSVLPPAPAVFFAGGLDAPPAPTAVLIGHGCVLTPPAPASGDVGLRFELVGSGRESACRNGSHRHDAGGHQTGGDFRGVFPHDFLSPVNRDDPGRARYRSGRKQLGSSTA